MTKNKSSSYKRATSSSQKLLLLRKSSSSHESLAKKPYLGPRQIRQSIMEFEADRVSKPIILEPDDRHNAENLSFFNEDDSEPENLHEMEVGDVLNGRIPLDISHGGGELFDIMSEYVEEKKKRRKKDHRTRRDRTQNRINAFEAQMDDMVEAYLEWHHRMGSDACSAAPSSDTTAIVEASLDLKVIDTYKTYTFGINLIPTDPNVAAAVVRHGLLPTAPLVISSAFSLRVVELYRVAHLRSPRLTIEPFVKTLCDLHRLNYNHSLSQQFTIAFDLYLAIRASVSLRVAAALGRNTPQWRLKNVCSACTYKLDQEPELKFKMLVTMDGNDSLKRLKQTQTETPEDAIAPVATGSKARTDLRTASGDYYIPRATVNRWGNSSSEEAIPSQPSEEQVEENPCISRWTNMNDKATGKSWGIFDENGLFLSLCRHGFVLLLVDMVQSGELSKYALSIAEVILEVFGEDVGAGYDVGCKFKTTLDKSELGPIARKLRYHSLVGSFHGHAHNRLCQLANLATYVTGMGLEDLEGCERFFSKSNALAPSIRYATAFHRQQKIVEYVAHVDAFETQRNMSKFIVDNYHQALQILNEKETLAQAMDDLGIAATDVFHRWLKEEQEYLSALKKEPIQETKEMDYYSNLVKFYAAQEIANKAQNTWHSYNPNSPKTNVGKRQANPETQLRHARENVDRALKKVQELEVELGITQRWTPTTTEWESAARLVTNKVYQRCLDELEGLVVARMFELTKMNMSQTGYKLRKHIGKALQARSQAIRSALERYNTAAAALKPPRPKLSWDEVVEYAFLSDFDLLRDCRQDIREREWARPAARLAMDRYFKMERAREEIQRLNVEIQRIVTHMHDEEMYLRAKEDQLRSTDPAIAHQVFLYREERTRFNCQHRKRFKKLATNPQFTGSLKVGVPIDDCLRKDLPCSMDVDIDENGQDSEEDDKEEEEEEEHEEAWVHEITQAMQTLLVSDV